MRYFRYLGPDIDGRLTKGEVVECDTQNDTPDGGIRSEFWLEVEKPKDG